MNHQFELINHVNQLIMLLKIVMMMLLILTPVPVTGVDSWKIASAAAEHHIPIQELTPRKRSLEDFYQEITGTTAR